MRPCVRPYLVGVHPPGGGHHLGLPRGGAADGHAAWGGGVFDVSWWWWWWWWWWWFGLVKAIVVGVDTQTDRHRHTHTHTDSHTHTRHTGFVQRDGRYGRLVRRGGAALVADDARGGAHHVGVDIGVALSSEARGRGAVRWCL